MQEKINFAFGNSRFYMSHLITDKSSGKQLTVAIRASGERTEDLCRELILEQGVPEENIYFVKESPFSKTLFKSLELGKEKGLPWLFCVDADLLLRPGSVSTLLAYARKQPEKVCEIQGFVFDKFFGGPRPGGVHLYRTKLIPELMEALSEVKETIRPEYHTLLLMKERGFPYTVVPFVVGLHDYEQYYKDIYRKCFVHGVKHLNLAGYFREIWGSKASEDPDFFVAIQAFADGFRHNGEVAIDHQQEIFSKGFNNIQQQEKPLLQKNDFDKKAINQLIQNWAPSPAYLTQFNHVYDFLQQKNLKIRIKDSMKNKGIFRTMLYYSGRALEKVGFELIKKGDSKKGAHQ